MWVLLALLGFGVGFFGTLVGAGGGFLLAPILVLMYPHEEPSTIASISLAVVFLNALSGSAGYWMRRRIDVRSGLRFSAVAVPGAVLGAVVAQFISRAVFEVVLGVVLIGAGASMLLGRGRPAQVAESGVPESAWGPRIKHPTGRGLAISFVVGFVSSLLGIGGGIIHVPAMVYALGFPVHVAAATSHFVLATTAGAGTLVHIATGAFASGMRRTAALGVGVVIGAQLGAFAAKRTRGVLVLRVLAVALLVVGGRIVWAGVWG
ncbi:MAG: sulfite exporter TauE/SafE family protein [Phycisphaerales bacterium]|nr:sulfite exporter TauE/SafE family protein [Phycisphaerales bacterium]